MTQRLFREEVLQANSANWLGGISLCQPLGAWWLASAAGVVALSVLAFLWMGSYTHRATVSGQLVPVQGLATVMAPASGVVRRLEVSEGQRVKAGQLLGEVTVPRATLAGGDTAAALAQRLLQRGEGLASSAQAQLQQLGAQEQGLHAQLAHVRQELAQVEDEVATRRRQIVLANQVLQRWRQLQDDKYVSALQIKQQESSALEYTSQMQALQRQGTEMRRSIAQIQAQLQELPGQMAAVRGGYQRDNAALAQEQVQIQAGGALAVTAPVTGMVAAQMVKPGQAIQAGKAMLSLLPGDGRLEAELLVPSRAIGFVAPGDAVALRYQAYPYQKFGHQRGTVVRVSRSALSAGELGTLMGEGRLSEPYYRVTVALAKQVVIAYGEPELLKPGMLLEADILGEKRSLIEWVFEPLWGLRNKISR